jgi:hypothetical protein
MSLDLETKQKIKQAFLDGQLRVKSVDPDTGLEVLKQVSDVMRHTTPHKDIVRVSTESGKSVKCTIDHSLFRLKDGKIQPLEAGDLKLGDKLVVVEGGVAIEEKITSVLYMEPHLYTYDISVPAFENFVLSNGILAHNSYSIGGVSLDIERSSKYESIKNNAEGQLDKFLEAKRNTVKIIRGLQQSRYGIGLRSALGPHVGSGVMHPRHYIGF